MRVQSGSGGVFLRKDRHPMWIRRPRFGQERKVHAGRLAVEALHSSTSRRTSQTAQAARGWERAGAQGAVDGRSGSSQVEPGAGRNRPRPASVDLLAERAAGGMFEAESSGQSSAGAVTEGTLRFHGVVRARGRGWACNLPPRTCREKTCGSSRRGEGERKIRALKGKYHASISNDGMTASPATLVSPRALGACW